VKKLAGILLVLLLVVNVPGNIPPASQKRAAPPPMPVAAANVSLHSLLQANPELKIIPAHDHRAWQ
jgi:hypothetical protein